MHVPVRTCIGCGSRHPQGRLLRLSRRSDGHVIPAGGRPKGRSAYICPSRACARGVERRRAAARAWKKQGRVVYDSELLWRSISDRVLREKTRLDSEASRGSGTRRLEIGELMQRMSAGCTPHLSDATKGGN